MASIQHILYICAYFLVSTAASEVEWRTDNTNITFAGVDGIRPWNLSVVARGNGELFVEDVAGQFRVMFTSETANTGWVTGVSQCIEIGSSMAEIKNMLGAVEMKNNNDESYLLSSIMPTIIVKKFGNGKIESNFEIYIDVSLDSGSAYSLSAELSYAGCTALRTVGSWDDPGNWVQGVVPNNESTVLFPNNSGVARLVGDVTLSGLDMQDGYIIAQTSGCADGWSPFIEGNTGRKCFKLYEDVTNFEDSIISCKNSGYGALDAQLAQIESYEERSAVLRMCRSESTGSPYRTGCWIGLRDRDGTGLYQWIEKKSMDDISFRDWRRTEELNRDVTEGFVDNGKRCVHTFPWQEDPAIEEQGSWFQSACATPRAFVCQHAATTHNIVLAVTGKAVFAGSAEVYGGSLQLRSADILGLRATHGAEIVITPDMDTGISATGSLVANELRTVHLSDGSVLRLEGPGEYISWGDAFIGELTLKGLQPILHLGSAVNLTFLPHDNNSSSSSSNGEEEISASAGIAARVESDGGSIRVGAGVLLDIGQGGELSSLTLVVESALGYATLGGYAARMAEYDSFDVLSTHRGKAIGEYVNNVILEDTAEPTGVYRLSVSLYEDSSGSSGEEITRCIDYHASAQDMQQLLIEDSALIRARGGVTVRRSGDGGENFRYGYRYRVEIDAPSTYDYLDSPLELRLACSGINECGCAQTKIPLTDEFGQTTCLRTGNISRTDPKSCVLPPDITVPRITQMRFTQTGGEGNMLITNGLHRLPPVSNIDVGVSGGAGTVAADQVTWKGITAVGDGTIIVAGAGWFGWDSSVLLYRGPDAEGRGLKRLNSAPPCNLTATYFHLSDSCRVLTAGPTTNMTWGSGVWSGGIIGGRSTLFVTDTMLAIGTGKALQYALTLFIADTGTLEWSSGDISLSNGADIIVEGRFIVNTTDPVGYIGQTQILSQSTTPTYDELFLTVSAADFNGYFDDSIDAELRTAWYMNPACGEQCVKDSQIYMRGHSQFIARNHSRATFVSPLNLLGFSTFELGIGGALILNAGGDCGNFVTMEVSNDAEVLLSGGSFAMQATCTITGDGELAVVNGTHNLCFSINAHITISGGAMVWPESRGAGSGLRFFGGLLIQGTGALRVEPLETSIVVDKTVEFKDECTVQFPMIGIAAQPSLYDTVDAPDISPRGSFTANDIMRFAGGTLRGKADFNVGNILYLEGAEKRIRSLAKLINYGHAEWSTGDIITADQGDFVNLGSVQMANGTEFFTGNMRAEGTIVPVESGGDVFALEFHSWDLDQGNLDFQEYVRLRTEFVSRAPDGWSEDLQH